MEPVGGSKQISSYTDQAGNPVSGDQMFRMFSESILANMIAFEEAGVPLKELKQAEGRDGGAILGRGVVFQTPTQEHLSHDGARQLIERYSELVGDYSKGQLDRDLIKNIKLRNDVSSRIGIIRSNLRKLGRKRN
jgi:hypothetical protein